MFGLFVQLLGLFINHVDFKVNYVFAPNVKTIVIEIHLFQLQPILLSNQL